MLTGRALRVVATVAVALSWAGVSAAGDGDDVVFLKDGGRLRGQVMEESPTSGVRVRLLDGTVRSVPRDQVDHVAYAGASAPQPPSAPSQTTSAPVYAGTLVIESPTLPGTVFLDGGSVGRTPLTLEHVTPGRHRVSVEFDAGGSWGERVTVLPGTATTATAHRTGTYEDFLKRKGISVGATGELFYVPEIKHVQDVGFQLTPFVNFAPSPAIEFRIGPQVAFGSGYHTEAYYDVVRGAYYAAPGSGYKASELNVSGGAVATMRINLASFYAIAFGVSGGAWAFGVNATVPGNGSTTTLSGMPVYGFVLGNISPVVIRLGSRREFEISYTAALGSTPSKEGVIFENLFGATYALPPF